MNLFNRIAMSVILLLLIVSALLVSLLPRPVLQSLRFAVDVGEYNLDSPAQLAAAVVGLLVAVVAFLLLVVELKPSPRQTVVVAQVAGGTAELTTESIALRVKRVAEGIGSIREATPVIRSRGKAVDILLRLFTDPDIDLPQKTEEVMQAVRSETEAKMGVPIKTLRVTVKHAPSEGGLPRPVSQTPPKPTIQR